jgi:hypothetical protein
MIAGLTGCVAVLNAQLPCYVLPFFAAIPLAAWLAPLPRLSARKQSLLLEIFALVL